MAIFEGAGVALVTPFREDGEVNYEKLEELLEEQIAGGTDAIISCGTTGESSTMSHEEHVEVVRFTCQKVKGRIPVIAGTGSNSTKEAVYLSREAQKAGADGLLLVTPYYNKATQGGLVTHFKKIAESVSIPVLLYHIPGRTGVTMTPETIVTLCKEVPNIVGVKEASGNFSAIAKIMHLAEGCSPTHTTPIPLSPISSMARCVILQPGPRNNVVMAAAGINTSPSISVTFTALSSRLITQCSR